MARTKKDAAEASRPVDGRGKGPRSEAAKQAGRANLQRGREKREEKKRAHQEAGGETRKQRWARLLDGSLTVRELDDVEIEAMTVYDAAGSVGGKRPLMPSHIAQQFRQEMIRRANDTLLTSLNRAAEALAEIVGDEDASGSDRIRAATVLFDRVMGKAPETVTVKSETGWEGLLNKMAGQPDLDRSGLDS